MEGQSGVPSGMKFSCIPQTHPASDATLTPDSMSYLWKLKKRIGEKRDKGYLIIVEVDSTTGDLLIGL